MPRKQKKYHYIYMTTCQVTGKFYVGMHSTDDLDDGYLGSGKILGYSRHKYGDENHKREILEFLETREALKLREKEVVNEELLTDPLNINIKYGGEGGWDHVPRAVVLRNLSKRNVGWVEYTRSEAGRKRSSELMKHLNKFGKTRRDSFRGREHSEATKKSIGLTNALKQAGEKNSQFGSCWVTNGVKPIKIRKEQLDEYLLNGYSRGRKLYVSGETVATPGFDPGACNGFVGSSPT